ncbi:CheR family methyltransferase [Undibacterium terreum]|uniref:protein-glutamate O-methyltransferase n=1 Tax=Undibacterium terreum TaxID=1224302 RepID=A0A916USN8_9BURK|nr:protein-glutamate O-methyltransferase CheR [Undibacterium terreum]GGC84816.1 chemotaxis protein methyltransferase [Undibacterium terreum]
MTQEAGLNAATLAALIVLIRKHTGISISEKKSILLERRLRPRLQALALDNYHDYLSRLERDVNEVPYFIDMVTTNDTLFFRTPQIWKFFAAQFLPQWTRQHPGECLRIWSAASASGEEVYSIAMLCAEFQRLIKGFHYQILGTDISQSMLATATVGVYAGRSVERVKESHPQLFQKYFSAVAGGVKVSDELKQFVSFSPHNLLSSLRSAKKFDIVFLRNVLIYFDVEHQQKVLANVLHSMKPQARLVVGESDSIGHMNTRYQLELPLVYRINNDMLNDEHLQGAAA